MPGDESPTPRPLVGVFPPSFLPSFLLSFQPERKGILDETPFPAAGLPPGQAPFPWK